MSNSKKNKVTKGQMLDLLAFIVVTKPTTLKMVPKCISKLALKDDLIVKHTVGKRSYAIRPNGRRLLTEQFARCTQVIALLANW